MSFSQNTTIYVFNNVKSATFLEFYTAYVHVYNTGSDTASTEHVMSMYLNVCLMMFTCSRNM